MYRRKVLVLSVVVVGLVALSGVAQADLLPFFGEDLGLGESTRLPSHPNADTARVNFFNRGYSVSSSYPYGLCSCGFRPRTCLTMSLYGIGSTPTACWTKR